MITPLPRLELDLESQPSQFDEAVILVNGHEEETIKLECNGALELAVRIIAIINAEAEKEKQSANATVHAAPRTL